MRLTVGKGIEEYISALTNISNASDEIIGKAVYQGAKIVADKVRANIEALPLDDRPYADKRTGIRSIQKVGLLNSLGVAKLRNEGGYSHVKIGFDGYNNLWSQEYPRGQPNAMIARTYEGGNSFTKKLPFVAPAVRATREEAELMMAKCVDIEMSKIYSF